MANGEGAAQVFKEVKISFGDFAAMFNAYSTQLKETEQTWRNIAGLWKTMPPSTPSGGGGSGGDDQSASDLAKRYQNESIKYFKNFGTYTKTFNIFSGELAALSNTFTRSLGISKILGAGSVIGTAAGIAGFAIDRATSFRDKQAQGAAYGLNPYQQAAFGNIFKDYIGEGGASQLFGGLVQQETTLGGPQLMRNWLQRYGVKQTGKETQEEQAENILRAERTMATTTDPSKWQAWIDAFKVGNVADINTMMRFKTKGTTAEELEGRIKEERKAGKDYLSAEDAKKLTDLARDWGKTIQDIGKGLDWLGAKLGSWFDPILNQWRKELEELMEHGLHKTPEEMKGYKWKLDLNFDKLWDNIKSLFGVSSAHAGELAPGAATTGGVPVQDKPLLDYLKQASLISTDSLLDAGGAAGFPGRVGRSSTGRVTGGGGSAGIGNLGVRGFWSPENEKKAYDKLVAGGFTPDAAMGYISRWRYVESSGGPTSVNPSSGAYGIAQALGSRKAGYLASGGDFDKQLDQVIRESKGFGGEKSGYLARSAIGDIEAGKAATAFERAEGYSPGSHTDYYTARTIAGIAKIREDLKRLGVGADHQPPVIDKMKAKGPGPTSMNDLDNYQGAHVKHHVALHVTTPAGANFQVSGGLLGAGSGQFQPA